MYRYLDGSNRKVLLHHVLSDASQVPTENKMSHTHSGMNGSTIHDSLIEAHCEVWEHEPCVDEDVSVTRANEHTVHPDLTQAANGKNSQWWPFSSGRSGKGPLF
jgi:hypothetical protein